MVSLNFRRKKTAIESPYFQHTALDLNKASIRLIQILPTLSESGHIRCHLQVLVLQDSARSDSSAGPSFAGLAYSCLSYTWGNGQKDCIILINEQRYQVHRNLWEFLDTARRLIIDKGPLRCRGRNENDPPYEWTNKQDSWLWIDALCIDQANIDERNHQVQQMGLVYSHAEMVIIWLGIGYDLDLTNPLFFGQDRGFSDVRNQPDHVYNSLSGAAYWTRAWITQEVVLAQFPAVCVRSGLYSLHGIFSSLRAMGIPENGYRKPSPSEQGFHRMWAYFRAKIFLDEVQERSVIHALDRFGADRQCADPRDRIYSVMALCIPNGRINVDYSVSRSQLMRDILMTCASTLCFCTIAIACRAVMPPKGHQYPESPEYIELEAPAWACEAAEDDTGYVLHTYRICEHSSSSIRSISVTGNMATVSSPLVKKNPVDVYGVRVISDRMGPQCVVRPWRFTFDALISLAYFEQPISRSRLCEHGYNGWGSDARRMFFCRSLLRG